MSTQSVLRWVFAAVLLAPLAGVQAATAVLDRLVGQPTIFEVGPAGARHASLPRRGAEYRLPIEIETGAGDAATFRLPDSEVAVAPNSMMRIAAPEAAGGGLLQRIFQQAGAVLFSVDRQEVEHFQVETPYLVSVVKGTTFNVVVHDTGATVALHEGRLLVTSADGTRQETLLPGDVAFSTGVGDLDKISGSVPRRAAPAADAAVTARRPAADADPLDLAVLRDSESRSGADADLRMPPVPTLEADLAGDLGGDLVAELGAGAGDLVADLGDDTALVIDDAGRSAGDLGGLLGDTGGALLDGGLVNDVGTTVGDTVAGVGDAVGGLVGGVTDTVTDLTGDLTGTVTDLTGDAGAVAGDLTSDLVDGAAGLTGTVGDAAGGLAGGLVDGDLDLPGTAEDLVGGLTGESTDLVTDVADTGGSLLDVTGDLADDVLDDGLGAGDSLGDAVTDPLEDTVAGLRGSLRGLLGGPGR